MYDWLPFACSGLIWGDQKLMNGTAISCYGIMGMNESEDFFPLSPCKITKVRHIQEHIQ